MRLLPLVMLLAACSYSCASSKQTTADSTTVNQSIATDTPVVAITFTKATRGHQERVYITKDDITKTIEGRQAGEGNMHRALKPKEWDKLIGTLKKVNVRSIADLESPSDNRATDAAMIGSLDIATSDGKVYTHVFDDENPNKALAPLMKAILALTAPGR